MSSALELAVRWEWIPRNPAAQAKKPRRPAPEPDPPTPEEAARIAKAAWEQDDEWGTLVWLVMDDRRTQRRDCSTPVVSRAARSGTNDLFDVPPVVVPGRLFDVVNLNPRVEHVSERCPRGGVPALVDLGKQLGSDLLGLPLVVRRACEVDVLAGEGVYTAVHPDLIGPPTLAMDPRVRRLPPVLSAMETW
jgi:hypothetical protein